jgi:hypothetical protein
MVWTCSWNERDKICIQNIGDKIFLKIARETETCSENRQYRGGMGFSKGISLLFHLLFWLEIQLSFLLPVHYNYIILVEKFNKFLFKNNKTGKMCINL